MTDQLFSDLDLPETIQRAVDAMGFEHPTAIQSAAIPPLLDGRDVVGVAQTGTGKTAAFGLPLLAAVTPEPHVQAVVLAPTRELAMQSANALEDFSKHIRSTTIVPVYGGSAYGPQIGALKKGAQVVVGTPGRVIDLIEKGALDMSQVRFFVLDEADEMLRMGFAEDVETIAADIPRDGVKALFSATMPPAIRRVAEAYLNDPVEIEIAPQSSTVATVEQTFAVVPFKHKLTALARVLWTTEADATIVFVRTRMDAEEVAMDLTAQGFRTAAISGDVAQADRERIVQRLRSGSLDVLVATDVAARGLDVERIGLVVNFDVPRDNEAYVHRIGRTGRAGREGTALTFFTPREEGRLRSIESLTGQQMREVTVPSARDVIGHRATTLLSEVDSALESPRLDVYVTLIENMVNAHGYDPIDIAAALLSTRIEGRQELRVRNTATPKIRREETLDEQGEFVSARFEAGRTKAPRGAKSSPHSGLGRGAKRGPSRDPIFASSTRYRVEVGRRDGIMPGAIVGAITGEGGLSGQDVGRIDIFPSFSLVELNQELSPGAEKRIAKAKVRGRALRIRPDRGPRN